VKKRSPARSATLLLLLTLATLLVWWLGSDRSKPSPAPSSTSPVPPSDYAPSNLPPPDLPPSSSANSTSNLVIDPGLNALADSLHDPNHPAEDDLQIVESFLQTYGKAKGGQPIGENADITAALTGSQGHQGRVFPPNHRTVRDGQLIDRWATPFWFHPNSGHQMEIRSAGPDRQLFTADDIVRNPSPDGLGITPPAASPAAP